MKLRSTVWLTIVCAAVFMGIATTANASLTQPFSMIDANRPLATAKNNSLATAIADLQGGPNDTRFSSTPAVKTGHSDLLFDATSPALTGIGTDIAETFSKRRHHHVPVSEPASMLMLGTGLLGLGLVRRIRRA